VILRSITRHVRDQNWFAVGLDFFIVIVGVFIGIQVANLNDERIALAGFEQQMDSLRIEMESNLLRIAVHRSWSDGQLEAAERLRRALSGDVSQISAEEIDAALLDLQGIRTFFPELSALQELADSGGLRRLNGTPIREALARWQEALAALQRMDRDALIHRDDVRADYLSTSISLAALLEHYPRSAGKVAPSRFRNDPEQLAGDVRLENFLAMRATFGGGIPTYLDDLEEVTRRVIELLEIRESAE